MMTVILRAFLAAIVIGLLLIWAAKADDMEAMLRKHYFEAAKSATLRDGNVQNCCGAADAVKVEAIGSGPRGEIIVRIVDVMRSANGKVGDVIAVPPGKVTVRLYSPFAEPILFISGANDPYCLSFSSGG